MPFIIPELQPKPCAECGWESVHHSLERWSLWLDTLSAPFVRTFDFLVGPFTPCFDAIINKTAPAIGDVLVAAGLAVKATKLGSHASETTLALWNEAERRGIEMYEVQVFGLARKLFIAKHRGVAWAFYGLPRPARPQPAMPWIDHKPKLKKRLAQAGFPVPAGGACRTWRAALKIFEKLPHPVIVKPYEGSGGKHTHVNIVTKEELAQAFESARLIAPFVIIEEQLRGPVFRATLIDKKLVAVLRRDPPHVVGDGKSTIRELVEKENKNPLRRGPVFAEIAIESPMAQKEFARQGFAPQTILPPGAIAYFHFKVNWGVGGTSRDATDETHPDNKKLFEDIGRYLGDDIVGVDFIIEDIGTSWKELEYRGKRCGVIECNSLPLIGNHHFPFTGKVVNVAGAIWDMVYPESEK